MARTASEPAKPLSKREKGKEERRQAILEAARKIFARKGFHNTSVSDIVKEVGIAQGTFYLYFDDKKAVFSQIVDDLMDRLLKFVTIRNLGELRGAQDVEEAMGRISVPLIEFFRQNRDLGKIFLREAVGTGLGFDKKINGFYDRITQVGVAYVEHFRKQGLLREDVDPAVAVSFVLGGAQMIVYRWVTDALAVPEEEIVRSVTRLGLNLFVK